MAIFYQFNADGQRGSVTQIDDSYLETKAVPVAPEGAMIIRYDAGLPESAAWLVGDSVYHVKRVETDAVDAEGFPVFETVVDDTQPPIVVGAS